MTGLGLTPANRLARKVAEGHKLALQVESAAKRDQLIEACRAIDEWANGVEAELLHHHPEFYSDFKTTSRPSPLSSRDKVNGWLTSRLKVLSEIVKEVRRHARALEG
jgi:hypothetical protein